MTEHEALELVYIANEAGNTALAIYLSIVSGYLVVAYVAGNSLTKAQLILVNSLFIFFSGAFTYSTMVSYLGMRHFTNLALGLSNEGFSVSDSGEDAFVAVVMGVMVMGIAGSLAFMWDIRRRSNDGT